MSNLYTLSYYFITIILLWSYAVISSKLKSDKKSRISKNVDKIKITKMRHLCSGFKADIGGGVCDFCQNGYGGTQPYKLTGTPDICVGNCNLYYQVPGNKECQACGSYFDKDTNSCVNLPCASYLVQETTNKICINCKTDSLGYFANGSCVAGSSCPNGYILVDSNKNGCLNCDSTGYYNSETDSCVATCPTYLIPNATSPKKCDNCKTLSLGFSYNGACIAGTACPSNTVLVDSNRNGCLNCDSTGYYSSETDSCVATCPTYLIPNVTSPKKCDNCKTLSLGFSYNGACIAGSTCPAKTLLGNSNRNGCDSCDSIGYYNSETNSCVASCPAFLIPNSTSPKACDNCKTLSLGYSHNGTCVSGSSCPINTILLDSNRNGCVDCIDDGKVSENGICVTSCSTGMVLSGNSCVSSSCPFMLNNVCVNSCPSGYYYNPSKVCLQCNSGQIISNNTCVSVCPLYQAVGTDNTCVNCKTLNPPKFSIQGIITCSDTLPNSKTLQQVDYNYYIDKVCTNFIFGTSCLDSCPINTATYQNQNICYDWKQLGKYLNGSYIVDSCPSPGYASNVNNECIYCKGINKYYSNGVCVNNCEANQSVYESSKICSNDNCKDVNLVSYNLACISSCPDNKVLSTITNVCESLIGKLYYLLILIIIYNLKLLHHVIIWSVRTVVYVHGKTTDQPAYVQMIGLEFIARSQLLYYLNIYNPR